MYNRRRARILLAVLVLVALMLVTVDFRSGGAEGDGPLGQLRGVASAVFGPVQDGVATIVRPLGGSLSSVTGLFDARRENVQLRAQLERLQDRRRSYEDVVRENEELVRLLDIRDAMPVDTAAAQVINWGPSNFEWTITLDVGSDDGVTRDMPVINGDGLVGRVIQTTSDTSRVLLAIDPSFFVAALHASTGEAGRLQGNGGEPMVFQPFDPEAPVEVGDEVVTSRYSNGVFPQGIPIGTVEAADAASGLLARSVDVRPWVDFTRLQTVLVVLYEPDMTLPGDDIGDVEFNRPEVSTTPEATETETEDPFDPFTPTEDPSEGGTEPSSDDPTAGE